MMLRCDYCGKMVPRMLIASPKNYYSIHENEVVCKYCADEIERTADSRWLRSQKFHEKGTFKDENRNGSNQ